MLSNFQSLDMSSFVPFEISILCESLSTCFTVEYHHWSFFDFHYVSTTGQLVFLQIILPVVHIVTLFTLKLAIQMRFFVSCKLTFSHTGITNIALLNCVDICNMLFQNICSVEFSFTNVTVGLILLMVFPIVLVKTKWTAEFFSTIVTLILDVYCSKSGMQLKSLSIFTTVSTFDF